MQMVINCGKTDQNGISKGTEKYAIE